MFRCIPFLNRAPAMTLFRALSVLVMVTGGLIVASATTQNAGFAASENGMIDEIGAIDQDYTLSDFSEFISADPTAHFDAWDKLVWTNRQIFNSKAFEELVVLYSYPLRTVCRDSQSEASAALSSHGGFLLWSAAATPSDATALAYEMSEYDEYMDKMSEELKSVLEAIGVTPIANDINISPLFRDGIEEAVSSAFLATNPIASVCLMDWETGTWNARPLDDGGDNAANAQPASEWWTPVPKGEVGAMLAAALHDLSGSRSGNGSEAEIYFMTADPVPGLEPTTQIWARCNVREPETLRSACRATLASSPYSAHQAIFSYGME